MRVALLITGMETVESMVSIIRQASHWIDLSWPVDEGQKSLICTTLANVNVRLHEKGCPVSIEIDGIIPRRPDGWYSQCLMWKSDDYGDVRVKTLIGMLKEERQSGTIRVVQGTGQGLLLQTSVSGEGRDTSQARRASDLQHTRAPRIFY
jgi:hypothetical protein